MALPDSGAECTVFVLACTGSLAAYVSRWRMSGCAFPSGAIAGAWERSAAEGTGGSLGDGMDSIDLIDGIDGSLGVELRFFMMGAAPWVPCSLIFAAGRSLIRTAFCAGILAGGDKGII